MQTKYVVALGKCIRHSEFTVRQSLFEHAFFVFAIYSQIHFILISFHSHIKSFFSQFRIGLRTGEFICLINNNG